MLHPGCGATEGNCAGCGCGCAVLGVFVAPPRIPWAPPCATSLAFPAALTTFSGIFAFCTAVFALSAVSKIAFFILSKKNSSWSVIASCTGLCSSLLPTGIIYSGGEIKFESNNCLLSNHESVADCGVNPGHCHRCHACLLLSRKIQRYIHPCCPCCPYCPCCPTVCPNNNRDR